jgi:steroid delta-isomerase-like uncharacterized protein
MSPEQNKTIVREVFEQGFNHGNLEPADRFVAENVLDHSIMPVPFKGREAIRQRFLMQRRSFPDLHFTFEDMVAEGDRVVWRWTLRGTDQGGFMGRPPTGRAVTVPGVNLQRLEDGLIVEHWSFPDLLGMLRQLGVIPAPGN